MDITIEGIIVHSPNNIERFAIKLSQENHLMVRSKLQYERKKIIDYFKGLREAGEIKSIYRPKNKKIKEHLKDLVKLKKQMKKSIDQIDMIYK